MHWVLIIFALIALAGAAGCLWYRQRLGREIALMAATATSKAVDVARLAPGTVAEVKGTLRCAVPLTAEFSKEVCVYHKSDIERETVYYQRDSQGRSQRKTRTETVHTSTRFAPCTVEDDSGAVPVRLEGAEVEGRQAFHRREQEQQSVAGAVLNIALGSGGATLIYTETVLAKDIPVYVLGEVQADRSIGRPAEGSRNKVYVVSQKSEEQRSRDLTRTMLWLLVGAIVLFLMAAALGYFAATV
jgi:hypothetical protein